MISIDIAKLDSRLLQLFRDGIQVIITVKPMGFNQTLGRWLQDPAHANDVRMHFVDMFKESLQAWITNACCRVASLNLSNAIIFGLGSHRRTFS